MKAALVVALVFLAGTASCSQAQYNRPDWIPEWVPSVSEEWGIDVGSLLPAEKPDWWPEIDWSTVTLPQLVDLVRELAQKLPGVIEGIELPDWFPDISGINLPPWWPPTVPELPELPDIPVSEIINSLNKPVPGVPARIQNFPSAVQIEYGFETFWAQACAGAIITNYHVLSTARCLIAFRLDLKYVRARVGATERYGSGSIHELASVIVHPSYGVNIQEDFLEGDIALGRLYAPVAFSDAVSAVQIVVPGYEIADNYPLILAGWASTAEGSTSFSNRELHSIDLVAINKEACVNRWSELPVLSGRVKISSNNFCAGRPETNGRDANLRDVGAPIYSYNVLMGFLSFGHYFGDQSYPIVATYISPYTNWILANAV